MLERDLSFFSLEELYLALPWRMPLVDYLNLPDVWQRRVIGKLHEHHRGMVNQLGFPLAELYR